MVVLRESPRSKVQAGDQKWPPRSPFEALLSSPSGRKKYESRLNRDSTSPSPSKRRRPNEDDSSGSRHVLLADDDDDDDDDEDEETLQLQLQAIEAKLKLKRLQQAKAKSGAKEASQRSSQDYSSRPSSAAADFQSTNSKDLRTPRNVQVPLSPIKDRRIQSAPKPPSPARVLLGIDKGWRAQDVSLKRPASSRASTTISSFGGQLSRSSSHRGVLESSRSKQDGMSVASRTFGERIAEARRHESEHRSKQERISQARSRGFSLNQTNLESTPRPILSGKDYARFPSSTSEDMRRGASRSLLKKSASNLSSFEKEVKGNASPIEELANSSTATPEDDPAASTLESYSGFHLNKRRLDHNTLTRALQGKTLYSIPQLLKEVKSPDYETPDCESDYVVLAIIASKSNPLEHRTGNHKSIDSAGGDDNARPKFMVLRLTDLKWELDLFLFGTGFETFWKLTPGTVIAVLNPGIMPPKQRDTGAFSLKLTSSEDTVLEIGSAKDMGFCNAIKSDGKECLQWIDARKTQVCEFHIALKVEKARRGRMEVNTMVGTGRGGGPGGQERSGAGRGGFRGGGKANLDGLKREGKYYDSYLHETMYLAPKELGFSATRLLDDQDADVNAWQRGCSKEEMIRRKEKEKQKERELASKLGALGNGAGSEYLKVRAERGAKMKGATTATTTSATSTSTTTSSSSSSSQALPPEPPDARALGLLSNKASDVSLNPVKRKRSGNSASEPMGWGGAFKRGLLSPTKSARKADSSRGTSPKKKARFMLAEKGIREPGRESLGTTAAAKPVEDDDDDDDLEIVRIP